MRHVVIFLIALIFSPAILSVEAKKFNIAQPNLKLKAPQLDMCPECVDLMDNVINQLLNVILNGGVLGSCQALCSALQNEYEATICNLLCDYVGIEGFIDAINDTDPDPIYVCQVIDVCPVVNNGSVKILSTYSRPASGAQGTTFTCGMQYQVISATGPGSVDIAIIPPGSGEVMSDGEFTEGQAPQTYTVEWTVPTTPSENEPFTAGTYQVSLAVCEGDCTTSHRWGGVYASAMTTFTIKG